MYTYFQGRIHEGLAVSRFISEMGIGVMLLLIIDKVRWADNKKRLLGDELYILQACYGLSSRRSTKFFYGRITRQDGSQRWWP